MSQIPFVNELGDALEAAVSTKTAPARRRRFRLPRRRGELAVVLLVLALAGAAAARILDSLTATTASTFAIQCMEGNGSDPNTPFVTLGPSNISPVTACRHAFASTGHAVLAASSTKLIVCARPNYGDVDVFVATGNPGQCAQLGEVSLPSGYTTAEARVYVLVRALGAAYAKYDCPSPATLAMESQRVLDRLRFTGWHARIILGPAKLSPGPCGAFRGGIEFRSDRPPVGEVSSSAQAALDSRHREVIVTNGRSRSMDAVFDPAVPELLRQSGRRCYSVRGILALARRTFAPVHAPIRFANYAELKGTEFGLGRQPLYDRGCTVAVTVQTAADGRTVELWLNTKTAPPFPLERFSQGWNGPAPSDYHG